METEILSESPTPPFLLDGPMGTELARRGVPTDGPLWSARALREHPGVIRAIHAEYARAGATIHTANTFRVRRLAEWRQAAALAVDLARDSIGESHRVAGSIAPVGDCYTPSSWRPALAHHHEELAEALADAQADLLLCETFANPNEARTATACAVRTGQEVWTALTAGPWGRLLTPDGLADAAQDCARAGASTVLVNCVGARRIGPYVNALAATGVPFGVYANAGDPRDGLGFCARPDTARYAELTLAWVRAGARVVGGCCGTGPAHIRAVQDRLRAIRPEPPSETA